MSTAVLTQPPDLASSKSGTQIDHLSWSAVKTYRDCPRRFWYRYVEKVPEEFVPASLAFGTAVHMAAQKCYQSQLEGRAVPSIEELLQQFKQGWSEKTSETPEVRFAKDEDGASLQALAERMLTTYRQHITDAADRARRQQQSSPSSTAIDSNSCRKSCPSTCGSTCWS